MSGEHVEIEGGRDPLGRFFARCSCGWEGGPIDWGRRGWESFTDHRNEALRPPENACRYCFAPLDNFGPLHCSDGCKRADLVRAKADARAAVLDAHRVDDDEPEAVIPSPDQMDLFS